MRISEHDVVRLIADIPEERVDRGASQRHPQIGDVGAVVLVHTTQPQQEAAYAVECVGPDGHTIWLADIFASELKLAQVGSVGA